jgi:hypothetical protein
MSMNTTINCANTVSVIPALMANAFDNPGPSSPSPTPPSPLLPLSPPLSPLRKNSHIHERQ